MKGINSNKEGCDPVSSNCVIWQGSDVECINLCKGDTVSTVVYKLATELCDLMDTFKITNFDLTCLNLAECTPKEFKELIQLLIDKICEDQGITNTTQSGCPDCEVNVCSSFYYTNPTGDVVSTMQLKEYVIAIGNKVCTIIGQITTINNTLANHSSRITTLENTPAPTLTLPQVPATCVLPVGNYDLDVLLEAVEVAFCNLQTSTGNPVQITKALQAACLSLGKSPQLNGTGNMAQIPGWYMTPSTLSESFSNLWKTVCDIRGAVQFMKNNCCSTGCESIDLQLVASLNSPTELVLSYNGSIPSNYVDDNIGSSIEITDVAGGGPQTLNGINIKTSYYDTAQQHTINLVGVNGATDVIVKLTYRFKDPSTGSTCQNIIQLLVLGTDTCPDLILVSGYTDISYSFTWNGTTPQAVTMELYDNAGAVLLQSNVLNILNSNPNGNFTNLTEGTNYKIRMVINGTPCDFEEFITNSYPCLIPSLNAPTIDYTNPEGNQDGGTVEGWIVAYDGVTH